MHELEHLYSTCACSSDLPDLSDTDDLIAAMMAEANTIWKKNGLAPGTINAKVVKGIADKLWSGVEQGYGIAPNVQFGNADLDMISHLKKDVFMFSAGKYSELSKQMQALMLDENGALRSKAEFTQRALKLNNTILKTHLATEYDTAIASATMARKWVDIEATKGLFPFLQFDAVLDAQSSETCPPLDGLIYPVDHEFWDQYYPPNHYNCRSSVRKLTTGPNNPAMKNADIPDQFRTNSAKRKEIFPEEHPYKKNTPTEVKQQGYSIVRKELLNKTLEAVQDKTITIPKVGNVKFTKNGIKEAINQPHKNYYFKNETLPNIEEIIIKSEWVKTSKDIKGKDVIYHYLKSNLYEDYFIVLRETAFGEIQFYTVVESLK